MFAWRHRKRWRTGPAECEAEGENGGGREGELGYREADKGMLGNWHRRVMRWEESRGDTSISDVREWMSRRHVFAWRPWKLIFSSWTEGEEGGGRCAQQMGRLAGCWGSHLCSGEASPWTPAGASPAQRGPGFFISSTMSLWRGLGQVLGKAKGQTPEPPRALEQGTGSLHWLNDKLI